MNRATFFRSMILGLVALPAVVKSLAKPERKWEFSHTQKYNGTIDWAHNPAWENAPYECRFAFGNRRGIIYGVNPRPLKFQYPNILAILP